MRERESVCVCVWCMGIYKRVVDLVVFLFLGVIGGIDLLDRYV